MDGARFANAVTALNLAPKELTWKRGLDVLCFGGTKLGLPVGDAVVFFDSDLAREFDYRCKQAGQLASKMRFLSAPWVGLFSEGAWLRHARHANQAATALAEAFQAIPEINILAPVQANAVFVKMPKGVPQHLQSRGWKFYSFIGGGARFMCSWRTQQSEIDALISDLNEAVTIA